MFHLVGSSGEHSNGPLGLLLCIELLGQLCDCQLLCWDSDPWCSCVINTVLTGIGGFNVRLRNARNKDKDEEGGGEVAPGAVTPTSSGPTNSGNVEGGSAAEDKPRRKAQRRRLKNRLMECYPLYLQVSKYKLKNKRPT